ncbi:MAG: hypothetical protein E6084_00775 [Peptoniphilus harei]|nr:hypothetical protein [Peptoniphilus harei]
MRYFNKKTGAILDSPSECYGGQWVEYDKKDDAQETPKDKVEVKEEVKKESSELTKEEVMNELDALGIDYDKKAKKEDLIKLMMGE